MADTGQIQSPNRAETTQPLLSEHFNPIVEETEEQNLQDEDQNTSKLDATEERLSDAAVADAAALTTARDCGLGKSQPEMANLFAPAFELSQRPDDTAAETFNIPTIDPTAPTPDLSQETNDEDTETPKGPPLSFEEASSVFGPSADQSASKDDPIVAASVDPTPVPSSAAGPSVPPRPSDNSTLPVPKLTILIDADADYTVYIVVPTEFRDTSNLCAVDPEFQASAQDLAKPVALLCRKQVLTGASDYFKNLFRMHWKESSKDHIVLEGDRALTMRLLLDILHDRIDSSLNIDVPVSEIWQLIAECQKYQISMSKLQVWFARWYSRHQGLIRNRNIPTAQVLFPAYFFNHAAGFARATKQIVLDTSGNFDTNINPTKHHHLRLPTAVIHRLLGVRGHLQKHIAEELANLLEPSSSSALQPCPCRYEAQGRYIEELRRLEIWPWKSVVPRFSRIDRDIARDGRIRADPCLWATTERLLNDFRPFYSKCRLCTRSNGLGLDGVRAVAFKCREYFDGLCLDCMNSGEPRTDRYVLEEELNHRGDLKSKERHDVQCRIHHGQPTEFWSVGLRTEIMVPILQAGDN